MVRNSGAMVLVLLLVTAALGGSSLLVRALQEYDYTISTPLSSSDYLLYSMVLEEGTELTVTITATGGLIDVYVLDAHGTSEFLSAMIYDVPPDTWSYRQELTQIGTGQCLISTTVSEPDVYNIAILNNSTHTVSISGTIVTQSQDESAPMDCVLIAVAVGGVAMALLLIIVLVLIPRTYRLQAEADSNFRDPLYEDLTPPPVMAGFGRRCPSCGQKNAQGSMFCEYCGEKIA